MRRFLWIAIPVLMCFLTGCPGGGSVGSNPVGLSVNPTSATLPVGGAQTFTANVTNTANAGVTWGIQEGAAGGTIDATGDYRAPATVGTYHLIVTSKADSTRTVTVPITVHTLVSIAPATATLTLLQSQAFTATVTGSTNTGVTWSLQEGAAGGMIDATGRYTAPGTAGTYHVLATSAADGTQASAGVTVQAGGVSAIVN